MKAYVNTIAMEVRIFVRSPTPLTIEIMLHVAALYRSIQHKFSHSAVAKRSSNQVSSGPKQNYYEHTVVLLQAASVPWNLFMHLKTDFMTVMIVVLKTGQREGDHY